MMKSILHLALALAVLCLCGLVASLMGTASAAPVKTSEAESLHYMRPGLLYSHQTVAVTAASAATTALSPLSVYRVVCSDDVFMDQGISTVAATTSEAYLPADVVQYIRTGNTELYLAFIRKTADCTCYVTEER
jgi:hypothetical protein